MNIINCMDIKNIFVFVSVLCFQTIHVEPKRVREFTIIIAKRVYNKTIIIIVNHISHFIKLLCSHIYHTLSLNFIERAYTHTDNMSHSCGKRRIESSSTEQKSMFSCHKNIVCHAMKNVSYCTKLISNVKFCAFQREF